MSEDKTPQPIFKIRIVYKSGYTHDFNCKSFSIKRDEVSWESADPTAGPILIGLDEIAAVWQLGVVRE